MAALPFLRQYRWNSLIDCTWTLPLCGPLWKNVVSECAGSWTLPGVTTELRRSKRLFKSPVCTMASVPQEWRKSVGGEWGRGMKWVTNLGPVPQTSLCFPPPLSDWPFDAGHRLAGLLSPGVTTRHFWRTIFLADFLCGVVLSSFFNDNKKNNYLWHLIS